MRFRPNSYSRRYASSFLVNVAGSNELGSLLLHSSFNCSFSANALFRRARPNVLRYFHRAGTYAELLRVREMREENIDPK